MEWSGPASAVAEQPWVQEYIIPGLVGVPDGLGVATRAWQVLPVIHEKKAKVDMLGVVKHIAYIGENARRSNEGLQKKEIKRGKNKSKTSYPQKKATGWFHFGWNKKQWSW